MSNRNAILKLEEKMRRDLDYKAKLKKELDTYKGEEFWVKMKEFEEHQKEFDIQLDKDLIRQAKLYQEDK